jgi:uncharacterized membrane protein YqgA involved in biofilm formation
MYNGLTVLITTFIGVFLKGFQHKNIQHNRYVSMTVLSYIISICELLTVTVVVKSGLGVVLYAATGAALGMVCGVLAHNKYFGNK